MIYILTSCSWYTWLTEQQVMYHVTHTPHLVPASLLTDCPATCLCLIIQNHREKPCNNIWKPLPHLGCARFPEFFLQNFSERQILWSLCSVVILALTLRLPIQTSFSVSPKLQVCVLSGEKCQNFSKTSTPQSWWAVCGLCFFLLIQFSWCLFIYKYHEQCVSKCAHTDCVFPYPFRERFLS